MIPKLCLDSTGAIRARLAYLRNRKVALDAAILALERYSAAIPDDGNAKLPTLVLSRRRPWPGAA